jgi:hypothetical protein
MACKPFSTGYKEDFPYDLRTLNVITKSLENASNKLQMIGAIERIRKNPSTAKEIYNLYAGDLPIKVNVPEGKRIREVNN